MEDTILSYDDFIALDPELTLLLANELVIRVGAHPDHEPAWKYRINPGEELERLRYVDAPTAAWARYRDMMGVPDGEGEPEIHRTPRAFSEATGLSMELIKAHGLTRYNSAQGVALHVLREGA